MRKVSEVLREEREKRAISLDEVQRNTKIRISILELLEAGDYAKLPPPTFVKGFIRNYGEFLGLDVNELLALYRREYDERKNIKPSATKINQRKFVLTPRVILVSSISLIVLLFVGYLYREYQSFAAAPILVIEEPQDNLRINKPAVFVVGRTDPDAKVEINAQEVLLGPGGTFTSEIGVTEGTNVLVITSTNKLGKVTTVSRTVNVELPKEEPVPPPVTTPSATEAR